MLNHVIAAACRSPRFIARYSKYVTKGEGCWDWTGYLLWNGYGRLRVSRTKSATAHKIAWTLEYGEIPEGLCVLHKCDNRRCVRPSHLFLGTKADNNRDRAAKGRGKEQHGESSPNARLTNDDVMRIRAMRGVVTQLQIASAFGVSRGHISMIQRGLKWGHIPMP